MDMILNRRQFTRDGIFGDLLSDTGDVLFVTLEHAYVDTNSEKLFVPKVPEGVYTCKRGMHRLAGMTSDFETFEITGVPGHTDILFHWGNFNKDSAGCVLLGENRGVKMIVNSKVAFGKFMSLLEGVDTFEVVIQDIESNL